MIWSQTLALTYCSILMARFWIKYAGRVLPFDHKHRHVSDLGIPDEFTDAAQLLTDFFADVDRVFSELKRR